MTVLWEQESMVKYKWLHFVEFLEMLCRIGIVGITMLDTLDYKVYLLLEILYEKLYKHEDFGRCAFPLYEVDEILRWYDLNSMSGNFQ